MSIKRNEKIQTAWLRDDKARRRLNTAPDTVANITTAELVNSGLTWERLQALNVPVYGYTTQVTIHGIIKDMPVDSPRIGGYKSLIINNNGSTGVKYSTIDHAKKRKLYDILQYANFPWVVHSDSTDYEVCKYFVITSKDTDLQSLKLQALDLYNRVPNGLYYGGKQVYSLAYGRGYVVVLTVGAIPQKTFFELANWLVGEPVNEAWIAEHKAIKEKQDTMRRAELQEKVAKQNAEKEARQKPLKDKAIALLDTIGERGHSEPGTYLRFTFNYFGDIIKYQVLRVETKNGKLVYWKADIDDPANWKATIPNRRKRPYGVKLEKLLGWWYVSLAKSKETVSQSGYKVTYERDWTWVKFASKPNNRVLDTLHTQGAHWSKKREAWYFTRHINNVSF